MNATALPRQPDPEQLRRQAKELLRQWRRDEPVALARAAPYRLPPPPRLAQAQLIVAREFGQPSWPALMVEVEQRRAAALDDDAFSDRVLALALGRGHAAPRPQQAMALLSSRPATRPPALRWLLGEVVEAPPNEALPPWGAPPLAIVAFSSLATIGHEPALLAALDRLLAAGASPNAGIADPAFPERPLPALYGAVARARSLAMVQRLLAAGAEPNDNESLYHAVEQPDRGMVAALAAAGARWEGTNALCRQLDFEAPAHLQQVLALMAQSGELSPTALAGALHHAVLRGRSLATLQMLVAQGADITQRDPQGHSLAAHAARAGRRDVLDWLATLGVLPQQGVHERFIAACAAADEDTARALLAQQPRLISELSAQDRQLLPERAQLGGFDAVRLMLALGWPVDVPGPWQASALNQAAFRGDAAMVQLLLAHGARWSERNGYGGTALGSCLHAGNNEPVEGGDYAAVLRLLLADGAPPPADDESLSDAMRVALDDALNPPAAEARAGGTGPAKPRAG